MAVRLGLFLGKRKAIRKRWLPYQEGHWLWIPLRLYGLHAVASVARIGPKGKVIAIYGFGPARTSKQTDEEVGRSRAGIRGFDCDVRRLGRHEWSQARRFCYRSFIRDAIATASVRLRTLSRFSSIST